MIKKICENDGLERARHRNALVQPLIPPDQEREPAMETLNVRHKTERAGEIDTIAQTCHLLRHGE
eukprot:361160-Chlamydomonas_euryale.AAC.7